MSRITSRAKKRYPSILSYISQRSNLAVRSLLAFVLIIFMLSVAGCATTNNSVKSISVGRILDNAKAQEQEKVRLARVNQTDDMVMMYRFGLIDEDFSEVKARLDRELEAYIESELRKTTTKPLFAKCDMEYFNASLKKARDENWGIEEILKDPQYTIRGAKYAIYDFYDAESKDPQLAYRKRKAEIHDLLSGVNLERDRNCVGYSTPDTVLVLKSLDAWENDPGLPDSLERTQPRWEEWTGKELKELKAKYNEEFVRIYNHNKKENYAEEYFAPAGKPELVFQKFGHRDKYLSVLAQKYMTEIVTRIIQEEGLEEHTALYVAPRSLEGPDRDQFKYDTSTIKTEEDILKFLNEGYQDDYDVNLIYLNIPEEEIDYAKIQRFTERVKKLITKPGVREVEFRARVFVAFYNVSDEDKHIVQTLFKRDVITENYIRPQVTPISEWGSSFAYTREETDGFHYLDCYGEKNKTKLEIHGYPENLTPEEFAKRYEIIDN